MRKLLSLPPNLVGCFHEITGNESPEWFCTADPVGHRLGSGGGTTWLLESCRTQDAIDGSLSFDDWLKREKRILIHAGGQGRRVPAYAPSGKILTPMPVFRWARGQKLSQDLLSLQYPLYERILQKAPDSLHTLIASGDVYIRCSEPLQEIPEADVVCYGLWVDPSLAARHGVFVTERDRPGRLAYMLQKPSLDELDRLAETHFFMMDVGIWLLNDRAVRLLMDRSLSEKGRQRMRTETVSTYLEADDLKEYDLYGEFGLALGDRPQTFDEDLNELTVVVLPLPGGRFYHYGTSRELISSTLAVQNLVNDQRYIMQHAVKPHPAMFVQNAIVRKPLQPDNARVWIENSCIGEHWLLAREHVITGVPENDWPLDLPAGVCIDVVPYGKGAWAARPYGFDDSFRGGGFDDNTVLMGKPIKVWAAERGIKLPEFFDLQNAKIFPLCYDVDSLGTVLRWMVSEPEVAAGREIWETAEKVSANMISDHANLQRLYAQRTLFRNKNWLMLAMNYSKSVFYQLDLEDAANAFVKAGIDLPESLPETVPLLTRIQDCMFRSSVLQQKGDADYAEVRDKAFSLLRNGIVATVMAEKQRPVLNVYPDQIVWGRSPVRIDLAGGWTDTPPYCMYAGGAVVNLAVELNGQPPLQVYVKPAREFRIILRSIDLGAMEVITDWNELRTFQKVGSAFSIPKAALALAGFVPEFSACRYASLEEQLKDFGCGIEVTLLAAVPAGSGLGTSSILAATVLGALSDFCGLSWDKSQIGNRTLILEQLLTTGGGWQDQYGGVLHGIKLLQTVEGNHQIPSVRWLPEYMFTQSEYKPCHLLYYTGITRTAKDILSEIVRKMFLNHGACLELLSEMKVHAMDMYDAIQSGHFNLFGTLVRESWEENKTLDSGTNPPAVEEIISRIKDYALGYKLPGAGGGGYLYIVAKDSEAAARIKRTLLDQPLNANARFVDMSLSDKGLQISRS